MKKLTIMLMVIICSLWQFQTLAVSDSTQIPLQPEGPDKNDLPEKGYRMPSAPFICTIDFENHRIETSLPYNIIAYELWDEDGDSPIVSYANDYEMVECMANDSGVFQFRIVTDERTYVGNIDL